MNHQSKDESKSPSYPSAVSYRRAVKSNQPKGILLSGSTTLKIVGPDPAFLDDIIGTTKNTYKVIEQSRVFFDLKSRRYFCYLSILPATPRSA